MNEIKKPTIYLETSTISFLTSRPSENSVLRGKQVLTEQWWKMRNQFDLFVSETVIEEIGFGDKDAAALRIQAVRDIPILERNEEVDKLAVKFLDAGVIPIGVKPDAFHIALAVIYRIDVLLTWNQKHIATNASRREIEDVIMMESLTFPKLLTPEQHLLLMEVEPNVH